MDRFITIATYDNYLQAAPIKSLLEHEGILCHTGYIYSFNRPTRRVRLNVDAREYERAKQLLVELGYPVIDHKEYHRVIPRRITAIGAIITLAITAILLWFSRPSDTDYATVTFTEPRAVATGQWCVVLVKYRDAPVPVNSIDTSAGYGPCKEYIDISGTDILLPGINTPRIKAKWMFNSYEKNGYITSADTLSDIYNGTYSVEEKPGQLVLTSPTTIIYCVHSVEF